MVVLKIENIQYNRVTKGDKIEGNHYVYTCTISQPITPESTQLLKTYVHIFLNVNS